MRRILSALLLSALLAGCSPAPYAGGDVPALQRTDTVAGNGAEAAPGMKVTVDYTGWLYDEKAADRHGAQFDSSKDHGQPFTFQLGAGQVISGWDEGVAGMKVGGTRVLSIPADKGYGAQGAGGVIPPGASLVFEITLRDVQPR